jgi:hypothetical protein
VDLDRLSEALDEPVRRYFAQFFDAEITSAAPV